MSAGSLTKSINVQEDLTGRWGGGSLPEAGVVADERRGQRATGREDARAAVVVAVRVDGRHVLHLVEAVRLLVGELQHRTRAPLLTPDATRPTYYGRRKKRQLTT